MPPTSSGTEGGAHGVHAMCLPDYLGQGGTVEPATVITDRMSGDSTGFDLTEGESLHALGVSHDA
jgi:hypothetical protein